MWKISIEYLPTLSKLSTKLRTLDIVASKLKKLTLSMTELCNLKRFEVKQSVALTYGGWREEMVTKRWEGEDAFVSCCLPDTLGKMTALKRLTISLCQLHALPASIMHLSLMSLNR